MERPVWHSPAFPRNPRASGNGPKDAVIAVFPLRIHILHFPIRFFYSLSIHQDPSLVYSIARGLDMKCQFMKCGRRALHHKGAASIRKYPWRHFLQSGTSAFHGSCHTGTAKLRSRVCRGGESCMRSFFACCVFMYLYGLRFPAASTLSGGRREIGSATRPLRSPFL